MKFEERVLGCILAGACGDALGYPVEHKKWKEISQTYGINGIRDMVVEEGIAKVTDDTQMTIYTAQGLIHALEKKCNYDDTVKEVHKSYLRWLSSLLHNADEIISKYKGIYSAEELEHNDLLEDNQNIGLDTKMCRGGSTFDSLLSGNIYTIANPADTGVRCGCTMRASPIAILCHSNPELAFRLGRDCAVLTHGYSSAYLSAGVMCMLIAYLLNGEEAEIAVSKSLEYVKLQKDGEKVYTVLMKGVTLAAHPNAVARIDVETIGLGWRADENLAIAIYCLLRYKTDIKEGLIVSANHDGDSDSVADVCGNIMGAYAGFEHIPKEWLDVLQFKNLLEKQAKQLCVDSLPFE